jgi:hypothetical protein
MRKTFFFQYTVKPEHRITTNKLTLDVLIEWTGAFYTSGRGPIVYVLFPTLKTDDLTAVTDWHAVVKECERIGEDHFRERAKEEKLAEARAVLNEYENPVLERYADPVHF